MFAATAYSTRRFFPVDPIYVADFETLRGITTSSMLCFVTGYFGGGSSVLVTAGWFIRDDNDTTSPDDNENTIVASNGKRWIRIFTDTNIPTFESYADLRAFTGTATMVEITGNQTYSPSNISGPFQIDTDDFTTADNNGTVIVDSSGRRWKRQYYGSLISPQWFGARPNVAFDSTAAFNAAIAECFRVGESLMVDGDYSIFGPVTQSGLHAIGLIGFSPATSRISYNTTDSKIDLTMTSTESVGEYTVSNIAFGAQVADIAVGLKLTGAPGSNGKKPVGAKIDHCYFGFDTQRGSTDARNFLIDLHMNALRDSTVMSTIFYGRRLAHGTTIGVYLEGDSTTGPTFTACEFWHCSKGITKLSTGLVSAEGLRCTNCIFVANDYGIHCESPIGDPAIVLIGNHFNNDLGNVYLKNINQIVMTGNLFYCSVATAGFFDVKIVDSSVVSLHDNQYCVLTGAATAKGIVLENVTRFNVHDEVFQGNCRLNALTMDANCGTGSWKDNRWESIPVPVVNNIADRTSYSRRSTRAPGYVIAHTPTAQVLTTNVAANVVFQIANVSGTFSGGWSAVNPTRLVVPSDVTLVRVSANIGFDANPAGPRVLRVIKNGSVFAGSAHMRVMASPTGNTYLNVATGLIEVVAGDYFEMEVLQGSGGDLSTTSNIQASFVLELVG